MHMIQVCLMFAFLTETNFFGLKNGFYQNRLKNANFIVNDILRKHEKIH